MDVLEKGVLEVVVTWERQWEWPFGMRVALVDNGSQGTKGERRK